MIERALELEPGRTADAGAPARLPVRRALLLARARPDAGAQPGGDRDRHRARRPRGARLRLRGAPARAVGRPAPAASGSRPRPRCSRWPARSGNLELQLQAHAWLVVDLLERGDRDAVDAQMEAFGVRRRAAPPAAVRVERDRVAGDARAAGGRARRADRLASEALAAGAPAEAVTAPQYYAIQLLAIRREQGRMGELEQRGPRAGRPTTRAGRPGAPRWSTCCARRAGWTRRARSSSGSPPATSRTSPRTATG